MKRKVRAITEDEYQHILMVRERLALNNTNWHEQPFVTAKQMCNMSWWVVEQFTPPNWHYDVCRMVMLNMRHPDNAAHVEFQAAQARMLAAGKQLGISLGISHVLGLGEAHGAASGEATDQRDPSAT